MSTFQFRLDRVLDWYRAQLRLEESRLATCLAAVQTVAERMARLQAERLSVEREAISSSTILARDLAALGFYRLRAAKEAAALSEERVRLERTLRDQRAAVLAAQRRVRLVEKLRDRRLSDHRYAENQALENLAAEAYLSKWIATKNT
jgi:flagellar export protein FliJ